MNDQAEELTHLFAVFAKKLATLDGDRPRAWRLCEAVRQLTGASGVALTVNYLSDTRITLCATDDVAAMVESLQEIAGEGPGFDAARRGEIVTGYLGGRHESRWPILAQILQDRADELTLFAMPAGATDDIRGVMTFYTRRTTPLRGSPEEVALVARTIGSALVAAARESLMRRRFLDGSWRSRNVVHQATGMVMARLQLSAEDALSLLRSRAYALNTDLADVARRVVDRQIVFPRHLVGGS